MRILDLIRAFRDLPSGLFDVIRTIGWDRISALIDLPDFENELEVRKWFQLAADVGEEVAATTDTKVDDFVAEVAQKSLESDIVWAFIYGLISKAANGEEVEIGAMDAELCAAAESVGIDPITIIAMISAAIQLIKLIREFRRGRKS